MSLGAFLGLAMLYYLHFASSSPSPSPSTSKADLRLRLTHLNFVLLMVHAYYVPAASGILYPGAAWMDPEFGDGAPQMIVFPMVLGLGWVGWWVERGRVLRETEAGRKGI